MKDHTNKEALLELDEDVDSGEGEVYVGPDFSNLTSLHQADLLVDWISGLEDMYQSVMAGDFMADMGATGINKPPASSSVN